MSYRRCYLFGLFLGLMGFGSPLWSSSAIDSFPGYFTLQNAVSGRVLQCHLDAHGIPSLKLAPHHGTRSQEWTLEGNGVDAYRIVNRAFALVLDLKHASRLEGAEVGVWQDLSGQLHQVWALETVGPYRYRIRNQASGGYLSEQRSVPGQRLAQPEQRLTTHGLSEQWNIVPIPERFTGIHFIENDYLKLGIDADAGGAVCWISERGSERNVINTKDLGRYLQQSYYAGHMRDRHAEGQSYHWRVFPWNPLQAGDYHGNRSRVLELEIGEGKLYVKTRPLLWDMNGEFADAHMEMWVELDGPDIIYHGKLTRFSGVDAWGDKAHPQELPAIYLHSDLKHFFSYTGSDLWNTQFNPIPTEKMWENWVTHESWVACVDESLWGFLVYFPGVATFTGGYYHVPGDPVDSTAFVSPRLTETIPRGSSYEYRVYFSLGRLNHLMHRVYLRRHKLELEAAATGP